MRRFALLLAYSALMLLTSFWTACGGDSAKVNVAAKIVLSPTTFSMNKGDLSQITATAQDSSGSTVIADFKYASSNENLFTVSTGGVICAGKWDSAFVNCTPTTATGSATLTVTAPATGVSTTADVFVHDQVDFLAITGGTGCTSSGDTQQLSAKAYSRNPAVCGGASQCELPANTVGRIGFGTTDTDIVTIDNTTDIGKATAGIPGRTFVFALLSGTTSPSIIFESCLVKSVTLGIKDSTDTSFTVDKGASANLVATAIDTKDKEITTPPLAYFRSEPFVLTTAAATPATTGTATGSNPGFSFVQAACIPPACNRCTTGACTSQNVPVYSPQLQGKVNGTANATVYAASSDSTQLIPIEASTNTAGTAITLQNPPDSMAVNNGGTRLALGGGTKPSMSFDIGTSAVTQLAVNGTVLGFARDGVSAVVVDSAIKKVYINAETSTSAGYVIDPPINRIDSSINPANILGSNGTSKFFSLFALNFSSATTSAPVNDVAMLLSGQALYLAGGTAAGIDVRAQCDASQVDTQTASNATLAESLPNGDGAVFLDGGNLIVLHNVSVGLTGNNPCPPTINQTRTSVALGLPAGFKANQLLLTPDSSKAILSTDKGLAIVNLSTFSATTVALGGGAVQTFQGGITLDGASLYIGADDGTVHRIDLSNNTDTQQIAVGLKKSDGTTTALPHFVVVRNKA